MKRLVNTHPFTLLLLAGLIATWSSLQWYLNRLFSVDGEIASLLPLLVAGWLIRRPTASRWLRLELRPAMAVLVLYGMAYWFLPAIFRALLAIFVLALLLSADRQIRHLPVAVWGLLLLALPVVASLQFYLGYPVRVVAGEISVLLLQLNGFAVVREGVVLNWGGTLVSIDAPCSGIKMLWTGLVTSLVLAGAYRMKPFATLGLLGVTVVTVVAVNALRVTSLFYIETGIVRLPGWAHDTVGLVTFGLIVLVLAWLAQKTSTRRQACEPFVVS